MRARRVFFRLESRIDRHRRCRCRRSRARRRERRCGREREFARSLVSCRLIVVETRRNVDCSFQAGARLIVQLLGSQ